jgi:hypothetical protein
MPLRRIIYTVNVAAKDRVLFSILEKSDGELIVPIRTAEKYGLNYQEGAAIQEQRYSIHPSLKSQDFTTVKHTTNLANGGQVVSVLLTDAVKRKTGFSLIFVRRVPDTSPDKCILSERDRERRTIISLPEYDPTKFTLFYGLVIGSPEVPFVASHPEVTPVVKHFQRFTIIALASILTLPSHYTSEFAHMRTIDPNATVDPIQKMLQRQLMTGKPAQACLVQYTNSTYELARRFLEHLLPQLSKPEAIQSVKEGIADLGRKIIPALALDTGPPTIHRRTSEKPPGPQ